VYTTGILQVACLYGEYERALIAAKGDPATLRATALPVRAAMVRQWDELMARLLETVGTRGALGTLQNMEAITRPALLDAPGQALALAIGEPVPQPSTAYKGRSRIFQVNLQFAVICIYMLDPHIMPGMAAHQTIVCVVPMLS